MRFIKSALALVGINVQPIVICHNCTINASTKAMAKLTETVTFRLTEQEKKIWVEYCDLDSRSQNDVFREYLRSVRRKLAKKIKDMKD